MNPLLNLIWLLCGGIFTAIEYLISSLLMMITIIGIPFGFQTLKLAGLALWPFGKEVRSTPDSGGCLSIIMNIICLDQPLSLGMGDFALYYHYRHTVRKAAL